MKRHYIFILVIVLSAVFTACEKNELKNNYEPVNEPVKAPAGQVVEETVKEAAQISNQDNPLKVTANKYHPIILAGKRINRLFSKPVVLEVKLSSSFKTDEDFVVGINGQWNALPRIPKLLENHNSYSIDLDNDEKTETIKILKTPSKEEGTIPRYVIPVLVRISN